MTTYDEQKQKRQFTPAQMAAQADMAMKAAAYEAIAEFAAEPHSAPDLASVVYEQQIALAALKVRAMEPLEPTS